ncbi:Crp/Fnr family transcriptional regulator [Patescibacteria group bacterium]|nr:Crp/Fnr family transcriptional regulator [Patescibacteria group bacterium]
MQKEDLKKIEKFFEKYDRVVYKKGESILQADDPAPGIFYLKKGYIRQYIISQKGEIFVINIFQPGSFFCMTWAMNGSPNSTYFDTLSTVEAYLAPLEDVREFFDKQPALLYDFTKRLLRGVHGLTLRLESLMLEPAYNRTAALLVYLAEKFGEKNGEGIKIALPFTHKEVASWIGTTRETASLQLEEMKKKGIVSYTRRFLIINNLKKLSS